MSEKLTIWRCRKCGEQTNRPYHGSRRGHIHPATPWPDERGSYWTDADEIEVVPAASLAVAVEALREAQRIICSPDRGRPDLAEFSELEDVLGSALARIEENDGR